MYQALLGAASGGGGGTSTSDHMSTNSGVNQHFGGINKSQQGIDSKTLVIAVSVIAVVYLLTKSKKRGSKK